MLPFHGRWRNASKRALEREARLLMFAGTPDDSLDDDEDEIPFAYKTPDEIAAMTPAEQVQYDLQLRSHLASQADTRQKKEKKKAQKEKQGTAEATAKAAEDERKRREEEEREKMRRLVHAQAMRAINADADEVLKPNDILGKAETTKEELDFLLEKYRTIEETKKSVKEMAEQKDKDFGGFSFDVELEGIGKTMQDFKDQIDLRTTPMRALELDKWQDGEFTPSEFLAKIAAYNAEMDINDEKDGKNVEQPDGEILFVHTFKAKKRQERREMRKALYDEAKDAVEKAVAEMYVSVPDLMKNLTEKELWELKSAKEKKIITDAISKHTGIDVYMAETNNDIDTISQTLEEKKMADSLEKFEKQLNDQLASMTAEPDPEKATSSSSTNISTQDASGGFANPIQTVQGLIRRTNQSLGIEWTNLGELYDACIEVIESIKEVKKRKRQGNVARNAAGIGKMVSWIPGLGGKDLENVLDEQQHQKREEFKEAFKKELGDNRKDYGFTDLFGANGDGGLLKEYMLLGDMNRTRAILEFAAGKGLLFGIDNDNVSATNFLLPGNIRFRDVLPSEWSDEAVGNYFGNLSYMNTQGREAAKDAGVKSVTGHNTVKSFVEPFQSAIRGCNLWFARGVLEAALVKVKDGEMSAMLTLTLLEEWEHNDLFRKYMAIKDDWMDRLPGDNKQLLVGMMKYDRGHLIAGVEKGEKNLAKARAEKGTPRIGPLVSAVRRYILKKDPSLDKQDDDTKAKFKLITAQVLASKPVKLPNGKEVSIYSPELLPLHIKYNADEMRDINLDKIGVDNFIERSEIIRGTVEVIKAIGVVRTDGFADTVKARYFFSHIADAYQELLDRAKQFDKTDVKQANEYRNAARMFRTDMQHKLNQWIEGALSGSGGMKVLTELHKSQEENRYLIMELVQKDLIPLSKIEQLARGNGGAKSAAAALMRQLYDNSKPGDDLRPRLESNLDLFMNTTATKKKSSSNARAEEPSYEASA